MTFCSSRRVAGSKPSQPCLVTLTPLPVWCLTPALVGGGFRQRTPLGHGHSQVPNLEFHNHFEVRKRDHCRPSPNTAIGARGNVKSSFTDLVRTQSQYKVPSLFLTLGSPNSAPARPATGSSRRAFPVPIEAGSPARPPMTPDLPKTRLKPDALGVGAAVADSQTASCMPCLLDMSIDYSTSKIEDRR